MRKITLGAAALAALLFTGFDMTSTQAAHGYSSFGLHIGGPNLQFGIGNTYGRYYSVSPQVTYRRSYSNPRWYGYEGRSYYGPSYSGRGYESAYRPSPRQYYPDRYERPGDRCDRDARRNVEYRERQRDRARYDNYYRGLDPRGHR